MSCIKTLCRDFCVLKLKYRKNSSLDDESILQLKKLLNNIDADCTEVVRFDKLEADIKHQFSKCVPGIQHGFNITVALIIQKINEVLSIVDPNNEISLDEEIKGKGCKEEEKRNKKKGRRNRIEEKRKMREEKRKMEEEEPVAEEDNWDYDPTTTSLQAQPVVAEEEPVEEPAAEEEPATEEEPVEESN